MNAIIEFIKVYWMWLVAVILITIITIIGFLADKKKNSKKEESVKETVSNDVEPKQQNNIDQPVDKQIDNGFGLNINNMDTTIRPISENNNNNNLSYNEPINNNMNGIREQNQNNSYQQQPMSNFGNNINNQEMFGRNITPQQNINNYPNLNSSMQQPNYGQSFPTQTNNFGPQQNPMPNQYPNVNNQNSMNQSMPMGNNNYNNNMNFNQNNTTVPTPVNPMQTPQPVRPQSILNGVNNMEQPMGQNFVPTPKPTPSTPIKPNQTQINGTPVSFVFGPKDNNQNM